MPDTKENIDGSERQDVLNGICYLGQIFKEIPE